MDELKGWLKSNGSSFGDLQFEDDELLGMCLKSGGGMMKNEQVIKVSNSCLINYWSCLKHIAVWNSDVADFVSKCHNDGESDFITEIYKIWDLQQIKTLNSTQLITLYLSLENERDTSFWKPFLNVLPPLKDFNELPLSWCFSSRKDHWKLLPKWCQTHVNNQLESFKSDVDKIAPFLHPAVAKEELLRFWLCLNTRCLYWTPPELLGLESNLLNNITMVPFVDFINHTPVANCEAKASKFGFVVSTLKDIKEGDHIWFTYGAHDSLFLQCEYGFSIPTGYDYVDITTVLEPILLKRPILVQWLKDAGCWGQFTIDNSGEIGFTSELAIVGLLQKQDQFRKLATGDWKLPTALRRCFNGEEISKEYKVSIEKFVEKIVTNLKLEFESNKKKASDFKEYSIVNLINYQLDVLGKFKRT